MDLTEAQWKAVKKFIPQDARREDGRGRPWSDRRRAFNGILWILRTGAPWQDLPERYGVIEAVLQGLARDLHKRGGLDLSECFVDGSFSAAKKGALKLAKPSGVRAAKSWQLETLMVFQSPSTQKLLRPEK